MPTTKTFIKSSKKPRAQGFLACICVSSPFPMECTTLSKGNSSYVAKALAVSKQISSLDNTISFYFING